MLKFFRNKRQGLLKDNKFRKYLFYALGEIILVVAGILIAISINNWNENNIERNKEIVLLTELSIDLNDQIDLLNGYIDLESELFQYGIDLLAHYSKNQTFFGEKLIYSKLNALITRRTFNSVNTTFQEIISTGNIGIIQDQTIKRNIIQYYHELERISLIISSNNSNIVDGIYQQEVLKLTLFVNDLTDPRLEEFNAQIFDQETLAKPQATSKDLLSKPENSLHILNLIEQRTLLAMSHVEHYGNIQEKTKKLLSELEVEIRQLEGN